MFYNWFWTQQCYNSSVTKQGMLKPCSQLYTPQPAFLFQFSFSFLIVKTTTTALLQRCHSRRQPHCHSLFSFPFFSSDKMHRGKTKHKNPKRSAGFRPVEKHKWGPPYFAWGFSQAPLYIWHTESRASVFCISTLGILHNMRSCPL